MDNASLDLLTFLLPLVEQLPINVLAAVPPGTRERDAGNYAASWQEDHSLFYTEIRIEGLSREDARTLLHSLVPIEANGLPGQKRSFWIARRGIRFIWKRCCVR